ncbi:nucleoside 2-deoxyribosyltransferase domain-containing protein [Glycomyces salinus]|uniref:nucleoside 2-deoxyribosyltransferase domain-containing protein n=1 Tax=Glycomyces salinus TaxID=980294 RepID=UPI0018EB1890|nr:nucleoside 2-deoxyribosyltransferase domain-containing protein [Glycomyces salinus]
MPSEIVVVHAGEPPPQEWDASVFLAGPVPREQGVPSWHPEAIRLLGQRWARPGRLVVFAPEPREGVAVEGIDAIGWEERGLACSDVILFWIPRDMATMPALTTNIEWGTWHTSGRAVLGVPPASANNGYPLEQARSSSVPLADTLEGTVGNALDLIGAGARRSGGERDVPLLVWNTPSFQRWYCVQCDAGNTLVSARVEWTFRVGAERRFVLYWAAHVQVHIAAEDRLKSNEVVISRPDASHVVLYRPAPEADDTVIVLVREFRSPASSPDGFVHELPGGSGMRTVSPIVQAVEEVREETGLALGADRMRYHGSRQVAATVTAHHTHLFSAEITETELRELRALQDRPHGDGLGSERTWVEISTYKELRAHPGPDWATLGMIAQALTD